MGNQMFGASPMEKSMVAGRRRGTPVEPPPEQVRAPRRVVGRRGAPGPDTDAVMDNRLVEPPPQPTIAQLMGQLPPNQRLQFAARMAGMQPRPMMPTRPTFAAGQRAVPGAEVPPTQPTFAAGAEAVGMVPRKRKQYQTSEAWPGTIAGMMGYQGG